MYSDDRDKQRDTERIHDADAEKRKRFKAFLKIRMCEMIDEMMREPEFKEFKF